MFRLTIRTNSVTPKGVALLSFARRTNETKKKERARVFLCVRAAMKQKTKTFANLSKRVNEEGIVSMRALPRKRKALLLL